MTTRSSLLALSLCLTLVTHGAAQEAPKLTLFMAGDSTMATQAIVPAHPGRGWGQMLQPYFLDTVRVENLAGSGQSTKSFRDKGRWQQLLDRVKPGDFVLIQFGHNDSKPDKERRTEPFGSFTENLERFVREVRERKATPILATSIVRNVFDKDGKTLRDTHGDYVFAVRKVAEAQKVPLLDLTKRTGELLVKLGPERAKRLFNNVEPGEFPQYPDGWKDGTHLNAVGACRVCDLAIEEITANVPELAKQVRRGSPRVPPKVDAKTLQTKLKGHWRERLAEPIAQPYDFTWEIFTHAAGHARWTDHDNESQQRDHKVLLNVTANPMWLDLRYEESGRAWVVVGIVKLDGDRIYWSRGAYVDGAIYDKAGGRVTGRPNGFTAKKGGVILERIK